MIQNRESFLATIAKQLQRSTPLKTKPIRNYAFQPQNDTLTQLTQDELIDVLIAQCTNIHTNIERCTKETLEQTLQKIVEQYGNGSIIYSDDSRFSDLMLDPFLQSHAAHKWQPAQGYANITLAEAANIGIVVSDITLAESATIVLQADATKGRTISFLPENSIAIIPKSTIVPRMTQAANILREQSTTASCINFISGPSNSADIELNLVVGVHGPIRMTYILVEDF
ncbi:MAG: lactate utilization protein C [Lysinibacillus sp.]